MNSVSHRDFEAKSAGKVIAARFAQKLQDDRAVLALHLVNGTPPHRLSRRKASKVLGVSRYRIGVAALATSDEIELLALGRLRLRDVRRAHAQSRKAIDDNDIIDFITRVNPSRVLAILDQMTAPPQLVAAE